MAVCHYLCDFHECILPSVLFFVFGPSGGVKAFNNDAATLTVIEKHVPISNSFNVLTTYLIL